MAKNRQPILRAMQGSGPFPRGSWLLQGNQPQPQAETAASSRNMQLQLAEKQKVKFIYGVLERQFRGYYERAERKQGNTGEVLLQELERRLDNVVFRMGYANTRREARQLVTMVTSL